MVILIDWILFILLGQKKKKTHEKVFNNKDFCGIVMPSEKEKILEFNYEVR